MMTILAVDDEPLVSKLVARALQENGFAVLTANCGAQAMKLFREHGSEVDLLISDITMPGLDGPSLARKLQAEKPDLKVLLMSGSCEADQLTLGFDFLPKPFSIADMLAKVRKMSGQTDTPSRFPSNRNPLGSRNSRRREASMFNSKNASARQASCEAR
jgi:DNA-binding response OmpR family regulator